MNTYGQGANWTDFFEPSSRPVAGSKLAWMEASQQSEHTDGRHVVSPLQNPQPATTEQDVNADQFLADKEEEFAFRSTMELFLKLENLPSLIEYSKNELREAKQSLFAKSSGEGKQRTDELESLKHENERLQTRLGETNATIDYKSKIRSLEEELRKTNEVNDFMKSKYLEIAEKYKEELEKMEAKEKTLQQYQTDMNKLANEYETLNTRLSLVQEQYEKAENEKTRAKTELSACQTRLSSLMGNKLASNNPDIADLSDKNRPTKLAEKSLQLYDNDWTNAFEVFQEHFRDEKRVIDTLMQMLQDIKKQCDIISAEQKQKLKEAVKLKRSRESLPDHIYHHFKEFRSLTVEASLPEVEERCRSALMYKRYAAYLKEKDVHTFFQGCIELCWLMNVQDPPLVFADTPNSTDAFDINTYKFYTETGPLIDYIVWPALLLKNDGPLLSKGIAQAHGRQETKSRAQRTTGTRAGKALDDTSHAHTPSSAQRTQRHITELVSQSEKEYQDNLNHPRNLGQDVQKQDYEQLVVSDVTYCVDNLGSLNRTTNVRETVSVADRMRKNLDRPDRGGQERKRLPVRPDEYTWKIFRNLTNMYSIDSPEVKTGLGENYGVCRDYYSYLYEGETAV